MAFLDFSPFPLFFLAIFALLLTSHSAEGINPICKTTHNIALCERIVKGAKNARDATINAISAATNTSQDIQKLIPLIEKAARKLSPPARDALVKSCTEDFQDTIGELNAGSIFIGRGDLHAADSFLKGALSSTHHCRDAVTRKVGTIVALKKSIDLFNKIMDVTLTLAHHIKM